MQTHAAPQRQRDDLASALTHGVGAAAALAAGAVLVVIKPVLAALDAWTFGWLLAGGVFYTLGTFFYHRESSAYSHAIWHLFCIAGSACHYIAVMAQVLPAR